MKKTLKRLFIYITGFVILAAGVNISKTAQLGISPVSAIPYAMELIWGISLGMATFLFNIMVIGMQIILLRKNYKPLQLLQLVCTYLFGLFITYTSREYLLFWLPLPSFYLMKILYLLISIIVIGIGASLYLIPNFVPLPAEGLAKALVELSKDKIKFSNAKVGVDSFMVLISALLSLVFLGGLKSVREGTILAALLIGKVVGFVFRHYKNYILAWIEK